MHLRLVSIHTIQPRVCTLFTGKGSQAITLHKHDCLVTCWSAGTSACYYSSIVSLCRTHHWEALRHCTSQAAKVPLVNFHQMEEVSDAYLMSKQTALQPHSGGSTKASPIYVVFADP